MIIEAEKFQGLLSTNWRPREARGLIQSLSECLRIRGADDVNLSPRAGEDEMSCLSLCKKDDKEQISPLPFYSI